MEEKNIDIVAGGQQETVLFQDACQIIDQAQKSAYRQVNETLIKRNWLLGLRIQHEVLKDKRAEYGEQVVKNLSKSLTEKYGSDQLYAAKYLTYMPSRTDLRREIEQQKEFFLLQHKNGNNDER